MNKQPDRRQVLKGVAVACAALLFPGKEEAVETGLRVAGQDVEIQVALASQHTVRLTIFPVKHALDDGQMMAIAGDGSLVRDTWGAPIVKLRSLARARTVKVGNLKVKISSDPMAFAMESVKGAVLQNLTVNKDTAVASFPPPTPPFRRPGA